MLNQANIIGHVGGDPDIRHTQSGQKIANFSIATSESWRNKTTGQREEHTEWHRIVVFGRGENGGLVSVVEKYVKKGSRIFVSGKLVTRSWEDQAGVKKWTTEIHLGFGSQLLLLDRAPSNRPPPATQETGWGSAPPPGSMPLSEEMDDEIPF